ncbi:kynurenine formamidase [Thermocatellispora tengchongensis]|uniref:Kynurenine formamidase n=1 Tax=Thermocatellispora tengchongensis TaxID=1073253 RepID=A0A840PN43_9ACTN|nr:cyclase family protein [Thermocatellispora tengchongensis]MBB5140462.1 kynurenine formamidase [Thermocatellispora tengchongensis]
MRGLPAGVTLLSLLRDDGERLAEAGASAPTGPAEGKPARTISDISLDELFRPGMVLDVRRWVKPGAAIPIEGLQAAIEATGREIQDGDAVLIRTGQERHTMADAEYYNHPGMTGDGTRFL